MKKVAALCILAVPVAAGADEVGHWYVTPQIGGIAVDNDRALEDKDWLYGLAIGKHLTEALSLEVNLNGAQLDGNLGSSDVSFYGGSLDLLGVANRGGSVSPYVSIGLGALQSERSPGANATDAMAQAGVGLMLKLWEGADGASSFSLRPELKARWDDAGAEGHLVDYIGTLGFQFAFGAPAPKPAPAPVAAPAPAPAPAPVAPPPPPAPRDTDGDGVLDPADRCPDTPRGVAVDANGCTRQGSVTLEGVAFELNSAQLTAASQTVLDGVATDLTKFPRLRVELQGHTDSSGSDQYNLKLSQQRAESVRTYLIGRGVSAGQLVARGYGESQPIAENTTGEGRAKNRRVVMQVLDNPGDVKVEGEGSVQQ